MTLQNSILVSESPNYILEKYGATLPVLVTEALTLVDRNVQVSAKLSETGWAWLVCNRRLFIWKFKLSVGSRSSITYCKELTLPPSDLAHKAELVNVFALKESQTPSAIAVSPEGIVRYWSNISHEVVSSETSVDLQGQECYSLTNIQALGSVLATTTSSLVNIIPTILDGQHTVLTQTLRVPQGILAGFGRRFSSFIFGAVPNQSSETKQLSRVLAEDSEEEDSKDVYVLVGSSLQKWLLILDEPEKLIYEVDLERMLNDEFLQAFSCQDSIHVQHFKNWIIDMQLSQTGIFMLAASINPQSSQQINYAFLTLDRQAPGNVIYFTMIKHTEQFNERLNERHEEIPERPLGFRLVLPDPLSQIAYFYNDHKIVCVSLSNQEANVLEFMNYEDKILGAGVCDNHPLFFSNIHGILSVKNVAADTSFLPNQSVLETTTNEGDIEELSESEDKTSRLRAAFLFFCRNDLVKSRSIIEDDFDLEISYNYRLDSSIDTAVTALSEEMINDYPTSDPRWADSVSDQTSFSSSLILQTQLSNKLRAHEMLLNFLKNIGLWNHLYQVTVREMPMVTKLLLCEHAEKLKAALSLKKLHTQYGLFLETGIQRIVEIRKSSLAGKLSSQDIFYRDVSLIDEIYLALYDVQTEKLSHMNEEDIVSYVSSVNSLFLDSLQAVVQFRQTNTHLYEASQSESQVEYLPWTSTEGVSGLRTILIKQHAITVDRFKSIEGNSTHGNIYQQVLELADLILDGYRCQIESLPKNEARYDEVNEKYIHDRNLLITPLLEAEQNERTMALAEKYCDFGILIRLCEKTNNQERLQRYMEQFSEQGFSDFLFKWYLDEGKRGKLLSQPSSQHSELTKFLSDHESLSWLHHINTGKYDMARNLLKNLAIQETKYMTKKKTILSISKLAALASDETHSVKEKAVNAINEEQSLLLYQETLPAAVLEAFGQDLDTMRVLKPEELIEMYVCGENEQANEYDFKKALDLLTFCAKTVDEDQIQELRLNIWCQLILRNNWEDLNTDEPMESVKETLFFRIIDLATSQNVDLENFVIPYETVLKAQQLEQLVKEPNFLFFLKVCYEYVNQFL